jgi:hypothetical protein
MLRLRLGCWPTNAGLFINNLTLSKSYCKNTDNTIKTYCISLDAKTVKVFF